MTSNAHHWQKQATEKNVLDTLVDYDADRMWCDIKHATSSSVIDFVRHALLNCACAL